MTTEELKSKIEKAEKSLSSPMLQANPSILESVKNNIEKYKKQLSDLEGKAETKVEDAEKKVEEAVTKDEKKDAKKDLAEAKEEKIITWAEEEAYKVYDIVKPMLGKVVRQAITFKSE